MVISKSVARRIAASTHRPTGSTAETQRGEVTDAKRMEHTPGPWRVVPSVVDDEWGITEYHKTGESVAQMVWKRDAALIAAAPDLLEACKRIAAMAVVWEPLSAGDIDDVLRAIAKAEGK